jgi:hypothetical protein
MVAFSTIAQLPIRQGSTDVPDLAASTSEQAVKLDPRVIPYFADEGARNSAYTAAIAGATPYTTPQKGMRCQVNAPPGVSYPDQCVWNGSEWIYDNPLPVTYNSGSISGTTVNYTTPSGHNPSLFTITPSRSGYAEVRLQIAANSGVAGYGSGFVRFRFSSGTLLPGGTGFTAIEDLAAGARKDTTYLLHPVKIYLTKAVSTSIVFDLWSNTTAGGSFWQLVSAQWLVTQQ